MKLILYRHNLKRPLIEYGDEIELSDFRSAEQLAARYAHTVEFHDGDSIKILKERYPTHKQLCSPLFVGKTSAILRTEPLYYISNGDNWAPISIETYNLLMTEW